MSDYDTDILGWSEQQAELLRQHAAGTLQMAVHLLKAEAWPLSMAVPH